ncbi:MAG: DUF2490 domain-containing protein [Cytophagaceae bacterium]
MKSKLIFVLSFFGSINLLSGFVYAQQQTFQRSNINQELFWLRYHNKTILSEHWEWQTHLDDRRWFSPNQKRHHLLIRTQAFYHITKKISISQGFVYALQHPQDPKSTSDLIVPEYRPFQEIVINNDLGKVIIRHRYRLEERFVHKSTKTELSDGFNFNWRLRYQFQAQKRLIKLDETRGIHFRVAEEIMLNYGKNIEHNIFDQSRFSAAFLLNLNKNFDFEVGYSHWYQQQRDGKTFFNRHIYRLTIFHSIDLRRKSTA